MILTHPFSSKSLPTGEKLFRRKHGYTLSCVAGVNTLLILVPYDRAKVNELEILNAPVGCTVDLKVLDTATGTLTTIPNYQLNQFGFDVNISKDYFKDVSQYDADVFRDMQIEIKITSPTVFTAGINIVFHEVVG